MKNTGITMVDVRESAWNAINELREGKMDIPTAKTIRELLDTIVQTGKTQVEFLRVLPEHVRQQMDPDSIKAIAGTLRDRDAELDQTLNEIEKKRNHY